MANTSCHLYALESERRQSSIHVVSFLFYHIEEDAVANIPAKKLAGGGARRQGDKFSAERSGLITTEQFRHSLEGSDGFAIDSIEEIPRRGDRCRVQYQCDPRLIIQITSPLYGILDHARFVPRFTPRLLGSLSNSSSNQRDVYSACPSVVFEEIFIVTFAQQLTRETDSRFQDSGVFRRLLPRYARFYGISRRENTRAFHWNRSAMSDLRPAVFTRNVPLPK